MNFTRKELEEWLQVQKNTPDAEHHSVVCDFFKKYPKAGEAGSYHADLSYSVKIENGGKLTIYGNYFVGSPDG